jgi:sarcosine oxidase subunit beta
MAQHPDVIITGSGITGLATAYELAKKGLRVTVLEAGDSIGSGGSASNGGGIRLSGRDVKEFPLAMYAEKK